jgi:hypothetical protein
MDFEKRQEQNENIYAALHPGLIPFPAEIPPERPLAGNLAQPLAHHAMRYIFA